MRHLSLPRSIFFIIILLAFCYRSLADLDQDLHSIMSGKTKPVVKESQQQQQPSGNVSTPPKEVAGTSLGQVQQQAAQAPPAQAQQASAAQVGGQVPESPSKSGASRFSIKKLATTEAQPTTATQPPKAEENGNGGERPADLNIPEDNGGIFCNISWQYDC